MAQTPGTDALATALAFMRRTAELAADQVRPLDAGCVVRTPSLPLVWALNHLRLSGPTTYQEAWSSRRSISAMDQKMTAGTVDQVVAATSREGRVRAGRTLAIRDESGDLVAMTKLYSDGITAQVEDVYTVPAWRDRGCARRLITRAISLAREAGHELVFIVADDEGWPKQLYSRLGFDPIGRMGMFHRPV